MRRLCVVVALYDDDNEITRNLFCLLWALSGGRSPTSAEQRSLRSSSPRLAPAVWR
jgi:hypothetical protein